MDENEIKQRVVKVTLTGHPTYIDIVATAIKKTYPNAHVSPPLLNTYGDYTGAFRIYIYIEPSDLCPFPRPEVGLSEEQCKSAGIEYHPEYEWDMQKHEWAKVPVLPGVSQILDKYKRESRKEDDAEVGERGGAQ